MNNHINKIKDIFLSPFPPQLILHAVFVHLSHCTAPSVPSSASHQACLFWYRLKVYKLHCGFGRLV